MVKGTVTAVGTEATVNYQVDSCGSVAENQAQLGHATNIAEAAGVPVAEVIAAREGGCVGWGVIAQQFQVPPGTLGLGNNRVTGGRPESPGNSGNAGNGNGNSNAGGGKGKGHDGGTSDDADDSEGEEDDGSNSGGKGKGKSEG